MHMDRTPPPRHPRTHAHAYTYGVVQISHPQTSLCGANSKDLTKTSTPLERSGSDLSMGMLTLENTN